MTHEFVYMIEGLLEGLLAMFGTTSFLGAASYAFTALALYTIAQRRGIKKPWLAWIPVVNVWILGSIADQYRYVAKGEVKNKRKVLLSVAILNMIFSIASVIRVAVTAVLTISGLAQEVGEQVIVNTLMDGLLNGMIFYIPALILSIVGTVFEIMALYDLYSSCEPANNVLFLVLSIIPGISHVTKPLFLFLSRNQDKGMPPRKENPAEF